MEVTTNNKMPRKIKKKMYFAYYLMLLYYLIFIILGLIIDTPSEIFTGLKNILFESNLLLTDYIELGGIGAALINSGVLSIMIILMLFSLGIKPNGATIAALWLISGFAFFGKNILNVWPGILGVWLYSKYQKEPFLNYVLIALFGTTLSPAVNELLFTGLFSLPMSIFIGISVSIFMGFILPPVASFCIRLHQGYSLYNIGLAAGLLGMLYMSILRSLGIEFPKRLLWSTGNNVLFAILLIIMFLSLLIIGFFKNGFSFNHLEKIFDQPGRLVTDFYLIYGKGPTFINMGILGIMSTLLVLLIGGELNGPVIGGIFTIVGFGAFGKHPVNTTPVIIGSLISISFSMWAGLDVSFASPGMILAILFCTTLAPIPGHFGWPFGILAGFLHVCIVSNVGYLHGGMNLYNNGFAGGLVAIILVPVITSFKNKVHASVGDSCDSKWSKLLKKFTKKGGNSN